MGWRQLPLPPMTAAIASGFERNLLKCKPLRGIAQLQCFGRFEIPTAEPSKLKARQTEHLLLPFPRCVARKRPQYFKCTKGTQVMSISRRTAIQQQALAGLAWINLPNIPALASAHSGFQPDADARAPLVLRVAPHRAEPAEVLAPSALVLQGWLGERVGINASRRLVNVDVAPLLAGFSHKPGSHPWIGEHVGKWLHAASLAWANTGDPTLRTKLDQVANALIATQESDGYLGTYEPVKRFGLHEGADWDVWSHKYCLIGLLTYHQYTRHAGALQASRQAANLLIATFPAKRSILAAGTHDGMAATSVLEPIVLLYRITGDGRYLRFARYIVRSWDEAKGPAIMKSLLAGQPVNKVSNGKAYEMLSNLVGLCELARTTGEQSMIRAVLHAWQDVVDNRLYATGTTSQFEHFQVDHDMRDTTYRHVGETCVTTTWIQLNLALLQLTGEARFGDELERSFYNHLTAAQHPDGEDWCYYTALEGRKQYDRGITCCHSSGPRGLALAPQASYLRGRTNGRDVLLVSTFESSSATLMLGGQRVSAVLRSGFPYRGEAVLTLKMEKPTHFALRVRTPAWAQPLTMQGATLQAGWTELPARTWKDGDQLILSFQLASRVMSGEYTHAGRAALAWGPFVLAYEQQMNPDLPSPRKLSLVRSTTTRALHQGRQLRFEVEVEASEQASTSSQVKPAKFLTFADAGATQGNYRVWMRAPGAVPSRQSESLLADGEESRSRSGNGPGSIIDDDLGTLVNTWTGSFASEDWFAVTLDEPADASRFLFTHGRNYHDGGWFDTQSGKPKVQIQRSVDAPWQTIGDLQGYPPTTATQAGNLVHGQQFALLMDTPVRFVAVRVLGTPSSGDRPQQSFVTCTELQAFGK